MFINKYRVTLINETNSLIVNLRFFSPEIASTSLPGQFISIKVDDTSVPLLRRPFSIRNIIGEEIEIIFGIVGSGTKKLSQKKVGEFIDVIGPLGNSFNVEGDENTAILVAGGLGVAPLPLLTKFLEKKNKHIQTFVGAKTKDLLHTSYLKNCKIATDDGSAGFHGSVVDLLNKYLLEMDRSIVKIYGCGPNPMLKALSDITSKFNIPSEVSIETIMACGLGICQGCAVKVQNNCDKYLLACKNGPVFKLDEIAF